MPEVVLRDVREGDLPIFFEQGRDAAACHMAAFTVKDPWDRAAFDARWRRLLDDETIRKKTIVADAAVAGSILSYEHDGRTEVCYWLGREYWGRGIAKASLGMFLTQILTTRPVYARVAKDNGRSIRVLQKCGFTDHGQERGFAQAREAEIDEVVMVMREPVGGDAGTADAHRLGGI